MDFDLWDEMSNVTNAEELHRDLWERIARDGTIERLIAKLKTDPLLIEYANLSVKHGYAPRITEPWRALGEQKMYALGFLLGKDIELINKPKIEMVTPAQFKAMIGLWLVLAKTYLWSTKIFNMLKDYPLPNHVIGKDLLPFPVTYHSTEVAYHIEFPYSKDIPELESDGMLLIPAKQGPLLCTIMSNLAGKPTKYVASLPIRFGQKYPDSFSPGMQMAVRQILSMLAFLRSPFTDVEKRKIPRSFRRHGGCAPDDAGTKINVVVLRQGAAKAIKSYNEANVEWKHQWWVRGHFRAQWYPSKKSHDVIWIAPYIKGPSGAPMLEKVYTVRR